MNTRRLIERRWVNSAGNTVLGRTEKIWATKPGIATLAITEVFPPRNDSYLCVLETMAEITHEWDIGPERIIAAVTLYSDVGPVTTMETIHGHNPNLVRFFKDWSAWVNEPTVQQSAIAHLRSHIPLQKTLIDGAILANPFDFYAKYNAWMKVAEILLVHEQIQALARKTFPSGRTNQTKISAMPLRIAMWMNPNWVPPIPKPQPEKDQPELFQLVPALDAKKALELGPERIRLFV